MLGRLFGFSAWADRGGGYKLQVYQHMLVQAVVSCAQSETVRFKTLSTSCHHDESPTFEDYMLTHTLPLAHSVWLFPQMVCWRHYKPSINKHTLTQPQMDRDRQTDRQKKHLFKKKKKKKNCSKKMLKESGACQQNALSCVLGPT